MFPGRRFSISTAAIETVELSKQFGDLVALHPISVSIPPGETFGLLGPNGASKSTTISMICGLLQPSSGDALIMGHSILRDPLAAKACLGVVPQDIAIYTDMSARENLAFWGKMYGMHGKELQARVAAVLELLGLSDRARERTGRFSGGMKRRLNIGIALLHRPKVIVMDEPTVGIDPQSRRAILDSVKMLNQSGTTVLYTTHYMEEAEELCARIAIIDRGAVIALGSNQELVRTVGQLVHINVTLVAKTAGGVSFAARLRGIDGVEQVMEEDPHITILAQDSNTVMPLIFEQSASANVRIASVSVAEPNLEAVFLHLTGRALRD